MPLVLLLPPDASPDDRRAFSRAAGWLAGELAPSAGFDSPARPGDRQSSTYSPVTDASRWRH